MKLPTTASREAVGIRLKKWRKANGLSQTTVAADLGMSQGSLCEIEKGKSHPGYSTIYKFIHTYPDYDLVGIFFEV